jgi:hypothetical protein
MEPVRIRCKSCNREIEGRVGKTVTCGCPNMVTIRDNDTITALDLSQTVMLNYHKSNNSKGVLTHEDIAWQEARRQRKVRHLDFEIK